MSEDPTEDDFGALNKIIEAMKGVAPDARPRILETVATFFQLKSPSHSMSVRSSAPETPRPFSDDTTISPKQFLMEKQPQSNVERIACLAYYLTHYRSTPHFKTLELSKLNTEAAQPKFSNAAYTSNDALKQGYLAPATKGQRQLSAAAEQFVRALPNREEAKSAMLSLRARVGGPRKKPKIVIAA